MPHDIPPCHHPYSTSLPSLMAESREEQMMTEKAAEVQDYQGNGHTLPQ